ncbi:hypothetical protein GSY71_00640 [Pusillimonas sp. TS35]|uniref:flagellar protein FlaG n=1 Tax=Paracandidimonas lactea TaxID=2895524 RepID=UPI00136A2199|nr:flagellar protein FlaG [Paracandidimonas lactea]MYN11666.1 hypothetical protein [Pusillimonas sp. TS35]
MVNPIAYAAVPMAADLLAEQRPMPLPDAAVKISAAAETRTSNDATQAQAQQYPQDPLDKALEAVNNHMQAWSTGMRFDIDPDTDRVVVSIIDSESGDVLRTVPTEAVIRVAKMIAQLQGRSVNTTA